MKSLLRSTAILGSSSLINIIVSLLTYKAFALILGISGFGLFGLIQGLFGLVILVTRFGIGTGLVRLGANALTRDAKLEFAALKWSAWMLLLVSNTVCLLLLIVFRAPISDYMLGSIIHASDVIFIGIASILTLAADLERCLLNAHHRINALAKVAILQSLIGGTVGIVFIWSFGERGIVWYLIVSAAMVLAMTKLYVRRELKREALKPLRKDILAGTRSLLSFGLPLTCSMIVGSGVQLWLPSLVLHTLDQESVGLFKAAGAISVGYFGFLVITIAQDFYPRVSAVVHEPGTVVRLINEQHRLIMLISIPLVLCSLAITPYLVTLIYSAHFVPAVEILEWQLIGNLLRFSALTMSYALLASSSRRYFFGELISGVSMLITARACMKWFGLAGLGISFFLSSAIYYCAVWILMRYEVDMKWTRENLILLFASVVTALSVRALPLIGLGRFITPLTSLLAVFAMTFSLVVIWRELGGWNKISARVGGY